MSELNTPLLGLFQKKTGGHRLKLFLTPPSPQLEISYSNPPSPKSKLSASSDILFIMYFVIAPNANKMRIHTDQLMKSKCMCVVYFESWPCHIDC